MIRASIRIGAIAMFSLASAIPGASQSMMQHVDLTSPEMALANFVRDQTCRGQLRRLALYDNPIAAIRTESLSTAVSVAGA